MKVSRIVSQSFQSIWSNKARSILTILGIVIGIAAVISLVGLGNGLQANVTDRIGGLGTTNITISSKDPDRPTAQRRGDGMRSMGGGFNFNSTSVENLTEEDYKTIGSTTNIDSASPQLSAQSDVTLKEGAETATAYQVLGVDSPYFSINDYVIAEGSLFTTDDVAASTADVMLGYQAAKDLFTDGSSPIDKTIYIKDKAFKVVGVLQEKEQTASARGMSPNDNIYMGYKQWLTLNEKTNLSAVVAKVNSEDAVEITADSIESKLQSAHGITDKAKLNFSVMTSKDLLDTVSSVTSSFTTALAGIAAISLVVGGIGIMNIMLVTVTERTREIGLRRAVGAKTWHIILQFLIESIMLSALGGVVGLLIGIAVSGSIGNILSFAPGGLTGDITAVIDTSTMILAVGISVLIGVVFGIFPAIKAAKLDPVEALRYE